MSLLKEGDFIIPAHKTQACKGKNRCTEFKRLSGGNKKKYGNNAGRCGLTGEIVYSASTPCNRI